MSPCRQPSCKSKNLVTGRQWSVCQQFLKLRLKLLLRKRTECRDLIFSQYKHVALHLEMELSTELGACEFILAGLSGSEVHFDFHSRNQILFEAQRWNPKTMNHVF